MNLILELQNRQTLYYDTSLNYYEAEQKQPRTFSCLKFNNSDLSSQVSIGSLKKKPNSLPCTTMEKSIFTLIRSIQITPNSLKWLKRFHVLFTTLFTSFAFE